MGPPSESLMTCYLLHLPMKVMFLVAVTSARRVGELKIWFQVLLIQFSIKIKFTSTLTQNSWQSLFPVYTIIRQLFLPVFLLKPHTRTDEQKLNLLAVRRPLVFYFDHTRPFTFSVKLFVVLADKVKGKLVSTQRISSWISSCICFCYQLANVTPPYSVGSFD